MLIIRMLRGFGAAGALAPLLAAPPAAAQAPPGADAYRLACAQCHGEDARGEGPLRRFLTIAPGDLTTLRQRDPNREFPFYRVFQMVDGRALVPAHGTREMPAWGGVFAIEAGERFGLYGRETYVRGRVVELVSYLEALQR